MGHSKYLGFDFAAYRQRDCGFVVTRHEIDYKAAALASETVHIATWVSVNDGRLRLRRRFQMLAGDGRELARGLSDFAAMKFLMAAPCACTGLCHRLSAGGSCGGSVSWRLGTGHG